MEIRRLEPEEFPRLKDVAEGTVLDPENCTAIVAIDGQEIVGRMFLVTMAHLEGTWIAERARRGTIGARLFRRLTTEAKNKGVSYLCAYTADPTLDDYMIRLGFEKLPLAVWGKGI